MSSSRYCCTRYACTYLAKTINLSLSLSKQPFFPTGFLVVRVFNAVLQAVWEGLRGACGNIFSHMVLCCCGYRCTGYTCTYLAKTINLSLSLSLTQERSAESIFHYPVVASLGHNVGSLFCDASLEVEVKQQDKATEEGHRDLPVEDVSDLLRHLTAC